MLIQASQFELSYLINLMSRPLKLVQDLVFLEMGRGGSLIALLMR